MILRLISATFLAGLLALTTGCNTMKGLGEDIQNLGGSIEGAASENENESEQ
ncbi:entericidin A/B family lipoprotein [Guyparkeria halophila]|uniref:Entericidin A/B family lipoprotein n=1 Tax=Guyparkeria halophila TaxID=47960 RepID=A0ABZ0YXV4_9GAMM|nr:entericidin A/B family lipoprotein [Guyparkeria halophila]WQH17011.1 entericidin A/B family lipoprotein [Guyparkeria halophila]